MVVFQQGLRLNSVRQIWSQGTRARLSSPDELNDWTPSDQPWRVES